MSSRSLNFDDYTVGWICALPIELAASQQLLDEEYEQPSQDSFDPNLYTLGRIGVHNVVLACLPAGTTGTQSAATVATWMRSKFPYMRFGLLVGIGGGVPSSHSDIRLGDVVISQPYAQHGGVVQYDFGKTEAGGNVLRTGWLNAPPWVLLNALTKHRALHYRSRGSLSKYLSAFDDLEIFNRDTAGPDVLYEASYDHVGGFTCEQCSKEMEISRPARRSHDVVIHYGTIASGNQVMRDGSTRDRISQELGEVLCFEMEAAGMMNNFPCLVIRGICDYADSHKNKSWQPYAAATAAACEKEILAIIPASTVVRATVTGASGQGRIETKLDQLFAEMRLGFKSPDLWAKDRAALEKELVDGTVTEVDVEENREFIGEWLKKTCAAGFDSSEDNQTSLFDEDDIFPEDGTNIRYNVEGYRRRRVNKDQENAGKRDTEPLQNEPSPPPIFRRSSSPPKTFPESRHRPNSTLASEPTSRTYHNTLPPTRKNPYGYPNSASFHRSGRRETFDSPHIDVNAPMPPGEYPNPLYDGSYSIHHDTSSPPSKLHHRSRSKQREPTVKVLERPLLVSLEDLFTGCTKKMKITRKTFDEATGRTSTQDRILEVPIKKGLKAGSKIKYSGVGGQYEGGTKDLHFIVEEKPHPLFKREGDDLHHVIRISLADSLCGWSRLVPTFETTIERPNGLTVYNDGMTPPSWTKTFPGWGMPLTNSPWARGSLVVKVDILYPTWIELTEEEKSSLKLILARPMRHATFA